MNATDISGLFVNIITSPIPTWLSNKYMIVALVGFTTGYVIKLIRG